MRYRFTLSKIVGLGLATSLTLVGLSSTATAAAPSTPVKSADVVSPVARPKAADAARDLSRLATRSQPLPAKLRGAPMPLAGEPAATTGELGGPAGPETRAVTAIAAAACTTADFANRSGDALVAYIKTVDWYDCINPLFDLTGSNAYAVFQQSKMVSVANGVAGTAVNYPGDNSTGIYQLLYFLRAGYYVQSVHPSDVGNYDSTLTNAARNGLTTYFNHPRSNDVSAGNGDVLYQAIIITDSAKLPADYIWVYKRVLNAYTSSWDAIPAMTRALNGVYTPLWRAPSNPAFVTAVTADSSIFDTLYNFTINHLGMLSGDHDVLVSNAGNDLGEMLEIPATLSKVRPLVKGLLNNSSITGSTANLWVHVAYRASSSDASQCSYYGTCDLTNRLIAASLPNTYICDNRTLRNQALTASEQAAVCASLRGQDSYFRNLVRDNGPIPGEYKSKLTFGIWASKWDYSVYSWAIYGNDTDNGGETLDGNPADPNNVVVTVMYQKPFDDGFVARVWNLNHEYTHMLDGIYDMKGDFGQQISVPTVWWIEGVAEYVSYSYRGVAYDEAIEEGANHTFKLSDLWQNTYAIDTIARTYNWGYLAVRYMYEKHPNDIYTILAKFRAGDYQGAYNYYNSTLGTRYDTDFNTWLDSLSGTTPPGCTAVTNSNDVTIPDLTTVESTIAVAGCTGNAASNATVAVDIVHTYIGDLVVSLIAPDGTAYVLHNRAGGGTDNLNTTYTVDLSSEVANGTWRLRVQDAAAGDTGYINSWTLNTGSGGGGGGTTACTDPNNQAMGQNCYRTNRSANAGSYDYLWIYLPAGTVTLKIATTGGTGNADLYYNPSTWATTSAYTTRSTNSGNSETITVTNSTAGYRYISLYGVSAFSGVTVTTQY